MLSRKSARWLFKHTAAQWHTYRSSSLSRPSISRFVGGGLTRSSLLRRALPARLPPLLRASICSRVKVLRAGSRTSRDGDDAGRANKGGSEERRDSVRVSDRSLAKRRSELASLKGGRHALERQALDA